MGANLWKGALCISDSHQSDELILPFSSPSVNCGEIGSIDQLISDKR